MWPIREIRSRDSGEGKSHKRALRGRTQMRTGRSLARADRDRDYEAVRFERRAPAQRLAEDPRAGYDPGLEFEFLQTVRLKACAFHCAGRDLPT